MELNLTLPIQIIHFCIVWYLLRTFYFAPAVDFITQKEQELIQLRNTIERLHNIVKQKKEIIATVWQQLKTFSKTHVATSSHVHNTTYKKITSISAQPTDHEQMTLATAQLKEIIIKKALHVEL